MTYDDLIEYFGNQAGIAKAFSVSQASVSEWQAKGVPPLRQVQAEQMTAGSLKAEPDVYAVPTKRAQGLAT